LKPSAKTKPAPVKQRRAKKTLKARLRNASTPLADNLLTDPVLGQRLTDISERIRIKLVNVPGLLDDIIEGLSVVQGITSESEGEDAYREFLQTPVTITVCREVLQSFMNAIMELGREEMRKKYALLELASAFDNPLDPDFEEVL